MNDAALLKTNLEIVENCFSSQFLKLTYAMHTTHNTNCNNTLFGALNVFALLCRLPLIH